MTDDQEAREKAAREYQSNRWDHGSFADQEEPFNDGWQAALDGPAVTALVEALEVVVQCGNKNAHETALDALEAFKKARGE